MSDQRYQRVDYDDGTHAVWDDQEERWLEMGERPSRLWRRSTMAGEAHEFHPYDFQDLQDSIAMGFVTKQWRYDCDTCSEEFWTDTDEMKIERCWTCTWARINAQQEAKKELERSQWD